MSATSSALLQHFFGLPGLREHQERMVDFILDPGNVRTDAICTYPTASGKSLIYIMPALVQKSVILVVSPLCSLILDQTKQINANLAGERIAYNLSGSAENTSDETDAFALPVDDCTDQDEEQEKEQQVPEKRQARILFCTPEKLACPGFRDKMQKFHAERPFSYFVIDECHLLIEQGYSFREKYLQTAWLREAFTTTRIFCFSATCSLFVSESLTRMFPLKPGVRTFELDAPKKNVHLNVHYVSKSTRKCQCSVHDCSWSFQSDACDKNIVRAAKFWGPGEVLVLTNTRSDVEKLTLHLQTAIPSHTVRAYHGQLDDKMRCSIQDEFLGGEIHILVATSASFGTGVNMPLVRKVVVVGVPSTVETMTQLIGRGGRNGEQYYVDFFVKEANMIKNGIMLKLESDKSPPSQAKYNVHQNNSYSIVQRIMHDAHKNNRCILNTIQRASTAKRTVLNVRYSDLVEFKKTNKRCPPMDRAKWDSIIKKWYLPPMADGVLLAAWGANAMSISQSRQKDEQTEHDQSASQPDMRCRKCSNCRKKTQNPSSSASNLEMSTAAIPSAETDDPQL